MMLSDSEQNYHQTLESINMSLPPAPLFIPSSPFSNTNDGVAFWPETTIENEQHIPMSCPEFQPFKKPRNFEDPPSNSAPYQISNPRMMPPPNPPTPRGISRIFFKTRLCAKFKAGTCPYGGNCNFAHGIDDMRKPPPNWQEIVSTHGDDRVGNWEEDQRIINRMKLCKKFYNGEECPYGERCNFLHEDPSRYRESSAISVGTTGSPLNNGSGSDKPDGDGVLNSSVDSNRITPKPFFWKTRMCNKWETTGHCPFGDKCHFAHGPSELQKFGGHNEVEIPNANIVPSKPVPNPSNDISPSDTGTGASKQKMLSKKCLLKWKGPEKISRIYADWIDDLPLVRDSPSKEN